MSGSGTFAFVETLLFESMVMAERKYVLKILRLKSADFKEIGVSFICEYLL